MSANQPTIAQDISCKHLAFGIRPYFIQVKSRQCKVTQNHSPENKGGLIHLNGLRVQVSAACRAILGLDNVVSRPGSGLWGIIRASSNETTAMAEPI